MIINAILSFTKRPRACVKAGMAILNVLSDKLFNDVEHEHRKWLSLFQRSFEMQSRTL